MDMRYEYVSIRFAYAVDVPPVVCCVVRCVRGVGCKRAQLYCSASYKFSRQEERENDVPPQRRGSNESVWCDGVVVMGLQQSAARSLLQKK